MPLTRESLLGFLEGRLAVETSGIDESTPLFSSGIIDSKDMVDLIMHIEREAGLTLGPEDITLENLDSVAGILRLTGERRTV